ncbi:MAG: hypothetical protein M1319_03455 [Chloroflexi bacterium]|nr:hypothetical protein [Chloroflexota bacterium]
MTEMRATGRSEVIPVALMAVAALALSSLPYLAAYLFPPAGTAFSGFVYNVQDMNSYLAKMAQGAHGDWLFHLPFTAQPHEGTFINVLFLLLGRLSALAGLPLILTFHVARLVFGAAMLASGYVFIRYFVAGRRARLVAFALLSFSSGAGWLLLVTGPPPGFTSMPIDFWVPDAFTFLVLFSFPHMALSEALLFWAFLFALQSLQMNSLRRSISAGVALALSGLVHPYCIPIAGVALGAYILLLWAWGDQQGARRERARVLLQHLKLLAVAMAICLPVFAYNAWAFQANPVLANWSKQNIFPSPTPPQLLVAFGLLGVFAACAGYRILKERDTRLSFLVVWVVSAFVLAYLPVTIQRRLLEGVHVPLSILAALGLVALVERRGLFKPGQQKVRQAYSLTLISLILLMSASNLILIGGSVTQLGQKSSWVFPPLWQIDAADWLRTNSKYGDVVLSSLETGNYLVAQSGDGVVLGHNVETVDYVETEKAVREFYDPATSDDWRRAMIKSFGVSYVYYGPLERQLGAFDPARSSLFTRVYENGEVSIYSVSLSPQAGSR